MDFHFLDNKIKKEQNSIKYLEMLTVQTSIFSLSQLYFTHFLYFIGCLSHLKIDDH